MLVSPPSPTPSGQLPPESFQSPIPGPRFYDQFDSPLSTKRERRAVANSRAGLSVPRLIRTAPATGRGPRRFHSMRPQQISATTTTINMFRETDVYNPKSHDTFFDQCFEVQDKLGEGSFGQVYMVRSKEDECLYAVKVSVEMFKNTTDRHLKLREVLKHESLPKHINLVGFVRAWEERGRLYIQTELCEKSLDKYCVEVMVPEQELWSILIDLISALDVLHSRDLLHVDIKPANIFLTSNKICKLGDFGLIFDLNNDENYTAEEGDSKYLAPEVLNGHPTKAADIFSLGITLLEVACDLDLPSRGLAWHELRSGRVPERFMGQLSPEMRRILCWMMHADPLCRPTSTELLQDPVVKRKWWRRKMGLFKTGMVSVFISIWMFIMIGVHFITTPLEALGKRVNRMKNSGTIVNGSAIPTPMRTTGYYDYSHTPEYADQAFRPRHLDFDTSYSDDESMGLQQPLPTLRLAPSNGYGNNGMHHSYSVGSHLRRRSHHNTPQQQEDLRRTSFTMNDTSTSSSSSSPLNTEEDTTLESTPVQDRLPEPLFSPARPAVSSMRRPATEGRVAQLSANWTDSIDASGDWGHPSPQCSPSIRAPPTPRSSAIRAPRFHSDDDHLIDDDDEEEEMEREQMDARRRMIALSCPPRPIGRSPWRGRPVPKLDFSLADSPVKGVAVPNSGSAQNTPHTDGGSMKRRERPERLRRSDLRKQRMVNDRGSSADDF